MNSILKINGINQKELESNVTDSASWHADYRDTPYIYIGFLPVELVELDILTIFSQFGIPTHLNLIKDKESGKSKGFCYLKYEDYRSCVLAIDNFNGISVLDKKLKVDHVYYQLKEGQNEDDFKVDYSGARNQIEAKAIEGKKKLLINDVEADGSLERSNEDEFRDPMEEYLGSKRHKSSSHRSSDRSSSHRSSSHRSSSDRSSSHRSSSDRSSSDRSSSHRSSSDGSSTHRSSSQRSSSHRSSSHRSSSHRNSSNRSSSHSSSSSHKTTPREKEPTTNSGSV